MQKKYIYIISRTTGSFFRPVFGWQHNRNIFWYLYIIIYAINKKSISNQLIGHWLSKRNTTIIFLFVYAVDGMWGSWTSWTTCSKTCGNGTRERKRFCDNPKPAYNGTYCPGVGYQKENCSASHPCSSTLFYIPAQMLVSSRI